MPVHRKFSRLSRSRRPPSLVWAQAAASAQSPGPAAASHASCDGRPLLPDIPALTGVRNLLQCAWSERRRWPAGTATLTRIASLCVGLSLTYGSLALARPQAILVNGSAPARVNYCGSVLAIEQAVRFLGWRFETHSFSGDSADREGPPNAVSCTDFAPDEAGREPPLVRHLPATGVEAGARHEAVFAAIDAATLALAASGGKDPFLLHFSAHGRWSAADELDFALTLWDSMVARTELQRKLMDVRIRLPEAPLILLLDVCFGAGGLQALFVPALHQRGKVTPLPGTCGLAVAGPDESALVVQLLMAELAELAKDAQHAREVDANGDGLISPAELARHVRNLDRQRATATLTSDVFLRLLAEGKLAAPAQTQRGRGAKDADAEVRPDDDAGRRAATRVGAQLFADDVLDRQPADYAPRTVAAEFQQTQAALAHARRAIPMRATAQTRGQLQAVVPYLRGEWGPATVASFMRAFNTFVAHSTAFARLRSRRGRAAAFDALFLDLGAEIQTPAGPRSLGELMDVASRIYQDAVTPQLRARHGQVATWRTSGDNAQSQVLALQDRLDALARIKAVFAGERGLRLLRAAGPEVQAQYGALRRCEAMPLWRVVE